ncbi:MAG TPA: putative lipid II flippase FtsW [Enteractinococcus helveticum]|uniref:Probable peptidoglycan glycosyltransferase FtsW n=1 Tax=Enteractinococcus helveticum TaxID=1837282 RepID=A0A921K7I3_9MICC|nr:putative lipid II flippase FtsW [Enteractinococcus helveticum]HJF13254.1 putative lipid II flippase FtsW [Enteractinococcus helveticum]
MTKGPAPRAVRIWDWLTGKHSTKSAYWMILGPTLALTFIGVVMVLSASSVEYIGGAGSFASLRSQGLYAVIGIILLFWMGKWRRTTYHRLAVALLVASIILLALVFTPLGWEVNGNRNWIRVAGFSFQPSEAAKLAFCVWSAYALSQKFKYTGYGKKLLVPVVLPFGALLVFFVALGRDLGTVLILAMIIAVVLYLGGMRGSYLLGTSVIGLVCVAIATALSSNRMLRIQAWLGQCNHASDPCYQYEQGIFALASGGWFGLGLGQSRQKWSYIPEAGNDFIFTVLGEELGLLGALLVIGLFITLGLGMFRVAYNTTDHFVRIATGAIMTWLLGQAFMNIAMVTGLLPVIGVPLPFISAGGSALLMAILAVGVVLSFARNQAHERQQNTQSATTDSKVKESVQSRQ